MLRSTEKLLMFRKKRLEKSIKKYKNGLIDEKKKDWKLEEALKNAKKNADFLRKYKLIEYFNFDESESIVSFGVTVYLKHIKTEDLIKTITILGIPDVKINPRYRENNSYIGYPSDEAIPFIGKRKGHIINEWEIINIKKFTEQKRN